MSAKELRVLGLSAQLFLYAGGLLTAAEEKELFQELIDTGVAWNLGGGFPSRATALIQAGVCHRGWEDDSPIVISEITEEGVPTGREWVIPSGRAQAAIRNEGLLQQVLEAGRMQITPETAAALQLSINER